MFFVQLNVPQFLVAIDYLVPLVSEELPLLHYHYGHGIMVMIRVIVINIILGYINNKLANCPAVFDWI